MDERHTLAAELTAAADGNYNPSELGRLLRRAAQALSESGLICYQNCEKHQGAWFTMKIGYSPPPRVVCPVCEPPGNADG